MVLRTGVVTREQWGARIGELLVDVGKESDDYADEIYEILVDMTLDAKDERRDETEMGDSLL